MYSSEDCVRGFLDGNLDYLAIGRHLVKHPRGVSHSLKPVAESGVATGDLIGASEHEPSVVVSD